MPKHLWRLLARGRPAAPAVAVLAVLAAGLGACGDPGSTPTKPGAAAGSTPTTLDFRGQDLRGRPLDLAELRGKVVLVNVWASWCEPCKEELPTLAGLFRARAADGLVIVGVSIDAPRAESLVRELVLRHRIPYPIVLDPKSTIVPLLKVVGYPTTVLIGRDGVIRWRRDGLIEADDRELADALEAALAAPSPDPF